MVFANHNYGLDVLILNVSFLFPLSLSLPFSLEYNRGSKADMAAAARGDGDFQDDEGIYDKEQLP